MDEQWPRSFQPVRLCTLGVSGHQVQMVDLIQAQRLRRYPRKALSPTIALTPALALCTLSVCPL